MTIDERDNQLLYESRRLPTLVPDEARTGQVRARCAAALSRRQVRLERRNAFVAHAIEAVLVGGLCLLYLSAVARDAFRLPGAF